MDTNKIHADCIEYIQNCGEVIDPTSDFYENPTTMEKYGFKSHTFTFKSGGKEYMATIAEIREVED